VGSCTTGKRKSRKEIAKPHSADTVIIDVLNIPLETTITAVVQIAIASQAEASYRAI